MSIALRPFVAVSIASALTACAIHHPPVALMSVGVKPADGITLQTAIRGTNLGLAAARGTGLDVGVASAMLLSSNNGRDFQNFIAKFDHLEVWMPISEAKDEEEAKFKMSKILETPALFNQGKRLY